MADLGLWITSVAAIAVAIISGIFALINRRGGERARTTPSWTELDKANRDLRAELDQLRADLVTLRTDIDSLRREQVNRDLAITNVLHDIAQQWPRDSNSPVFNPRDLEVLGDTVPKNWRLAT